MHTGTGANLELVAELEVALAHAQAGLVEAAHLGVELGAAGGEQQVLALQLLNPPLLLLTPLLDQQGGRVFIDCQAKFPWRKPKGSNSFHTNKFKLHGRYIVQYIDRVPHYATFSKYSGGGGGGV
jgi:hypothetical protein